MDLRPYQNEAIKAILTKWKDWDRELLILPTGCGKTIVFNHIANMRNNRTLILCHREELIEQARDKYFSLFGEMPGKIKAQEEVIKKITVGSVQTMARRDYTDMFDTVIIDEAHHCVSNSYQKVLCQFPNAKVLGVTATIERFDKKSLASYFEGIAYEYTFKQAVTDKYLVRPIARCIPLSIDISKVTVKVGDFELTELSEALEPYLPEIAKAIKEYASDRKTIVFMPLVHIAQEMRDELVKIGMDTKEVNGLSPDRGEVLDWYSKSGKGSVLVNSMLLTEGYDEPSIDCVVVLRPTKSTSLYRQMIGRGTRPSTGKQDLLILDFLWMTQRHDLCRPAVLITENQQEKEYIKERSEEDEIDLFESLSDAEEARREALARELQRQAHKKAKLVDPMRFFMAIGDLSLADYEPVFEWQTKDPTEKQIKMLEGFGLNPDEFDRGKASLVIDTMLGRRDLASPKQIELLRRFGYHPEQWTKQMATAKITALKAVGFKRWKLHE